MQIELKQIQREAGITFIFVTHDQEEALTLSDRIAVYNNGNIEQVGSPREVYEFPQTEFVARFLGITNLLTPDISERLLGTRTPHSLRPERLQLQDPAYVMSPDEIGLPGRISETSYAGPHTKYIIETDQGIRLVAEKHNIHTPRTDASVQRGDRVLALFHRDHATPIAPAPSIELSTAA